MAEPQEMLVTYVKNYPGRFEKLKAVRDAMSLDDGAKIVLTYNSKDFNPERVRIIIYVLTPGGQISKCIKILMRFVNECEEMFRMKSYASSRNRKMRPLDKWSLLFSKPYENTGSIKTYEELYAHTTPEHNVYFIN
jgi:hypothetical protein